MSEVQGPGRSGPPARPGEPAADSDTVGADTSATDAATATTGAATITVSGSIRQTQGATVEDGVGFDDSAVAAQRGLVGVAVDAPGEGVTFRFEDAGDGVVQATRYEVRGGVEVATATQALAVPGAGDTVDRGAAPGVLTFDRLGLQLGLGEDYTPGDLAFVSIASGPTTADRVEAGDPAGDAATAPGTGTATGLDATQLQQRRQELEAAIAAEEASLVSVLGQLVGQDTGLPAALLTGSGYTDARDALLQQMTEILRAPSTLTGDRVLQLLG